MHDVIVAGTGPSGASTAYELARRGHRVLILERAKLPRYKTCGGAIPLNFFKTLPERVQKTLEGYLTEVAYYGPGGTNILAQNTAKIAGVMREKFDYEFTMAAVDAGAELIDSNPVTGVEEREDRVVVTTPQGLFEARYLAGADGATGAVKRLLKIGRPSALAAALEVEVKPRGAATKGDLTLVHFTTIRDGYAWVFPKGDIDSVGIASFGRDRGIVKKKLAEWAQFCGYSLEGQVTHGHPIPVWRSKSDLASKRTVLVGDAACTVDPLGGEGIRYGIRCGRIAAEHVSKALRNGGGLEGYTRAVHKEILSDFVYARHVADFFYRFPEFCYRIWVRSPAATRFMGKVLYGELRYRDLFRTAAASFFRPRVWKALLSKS